MGANNSVPADYTVPAYTILAIDVVLTTAAVVGRTASRRLLKTSPAVDDYLCYFAFIANLGLLLSGLLLTAFGAVDLEDVSVQSVKEQIFVTNTTLSFAVIYIVAITLVKLSILFLYHRTFTVREKWFRYCWWILMAFTILWTLACLILLALQETGELPRYAFGRIVVPTTGIFNAFSDMLLMLLPIVMVSRLKMRRKQKIALISIFCISGIASIVSLVRGTIYFYNRGHRLNLAYMNYLDIVLTATESSAGLMCACLPLTKPLVIRFTKWLQRLHGLDTNHHGWTTVSHSGNIKEKNKGITRVDDYSVQLLRASDPALSQMGALNGDFMNVDMPWQSVGPYQTNAFCESNAHKGTPEECVEKWEVQTTWGL
ncbi:hypothetical protein IQ06DRAFT_81410 [Phaeosphaeriaceae sp. SRC1lsM3a]|nr:hypothetical protein IQ06DRAFT_81410 [Stagonospora sp. SRC1lsM3a]